MIHSSELGINRFAILREQTHKQMEEELAVRLQENPIPTDEEIAMGAFAEMLEPQVRDALFEMRYL